jgi:hypothetical protein
LFTHHHKDKITMKQEDIQIGVTYLVGLAGNLVPVLITDNHPSGSGWLGKTIKTGKQITIKSAQRIHRKASDDKQINDVAKQDNRKPKTATGSNQDGDKPMSLINAAAHILAQGKQEPMRCKDIVEQAIEQKLWQPGKGLTPASTLYAAIGREIKTKGEASRFVKAERGMFTLKEQGS